MQFIPFSGSIGILVNLNGRDKGYIGVKRFVLAVSVKVLEA